MKPAGLIDTLALARRAWPGGKNGLATVIERCALSDHIDTLAPDSQPHRNLWDTVATAVLFTHLTRHIPDSDLIAAIAKSIKAPSSEQPTLF